MATGPDNNPSVPSPLSISRSPQDDEVVKKNSKNSSGTTTKKQQRKQQHGYQNQVSNNIHTNQDQSSSSSCFSPTSITGLPMIRQQCPHSSPQSYTGDSNGRRGGGREAYSPAPHGVDTTWTSIMTSSPDHSTCRRIRFPPPPYRPSSSGESHMTTKSIASVSRTSSSLPPPPPRPPPPRASSHQGQQHLTSPPPMSCYTPYSSHRFSSPKDDDAPASFSSTMKKSWGSNGGHGSPIDSDKNFNGVVFSDSCQSWTNEQQHCTKLLPSPNKRCKKKKENKKKNEKSMDQGEKTTVNQNTIRSYYSNSGNSKTTAVADRNSSSNKNHHIIQTQTMPHCISAPTSQQQNDTFTSRHTFADRNSDLLERVSTVCESIYSYLDEFDRRNKNTLSTSVVNDSYGNDKDSPSFSTPENNRSRRRHTTDTDNFSIKPVVSLSSSHVDNVKIKMREHNDLSFNPGRNNSSSPLVYSRRHSTGSPYSRWHSTISAKMSVMSPMTTEQTSRMTVATNSQGGGNATTTTAAAIPKSNNKNSINSGSSYKKNAHSLLADPSTPSSQDYTSSLQSVVHVQKQLTRMQSSSSSSSTMSEQPASLQHQPKQPPLQQRRRHYLRSLSMDDSEIMMRRGEGGQINECLSSKAVIDNLAYQFSNTRRCRSTSSRRNLSSGNCAQMNSLLKTQSLLQQLRASLEDDAVTRNCTPLRNKEHMAHKLLPPPSTPVTFWPEDGRLCLDGFG